MISSLSKRFLIITLSLIILGVITFSPFIVGAQGYTFLDSTVIESGGCFSGGEIDFICYVQKIYTTVLVVVVVLSIFMIALGGLEYIASGAAGAKTEGKQRITHAIIGLLIALASYFILYTIDPSFVNFKLPLSPVSIASNPGGGTGNGNNNGGGDNGGGNNNGGGTDLGVLAGPRREGETNAQAILRNAQYAANTGVDTCNMPGTSGGTLACAGAVNNIVRAATDEVVGGGLSTANMYDVLKTSPRYQLIGEGDSGIALGQPGDIIIAPSTTGPNKVHGHVGICETVGCRSIVSNQSGNAEVGRESLTAYRRNHNEPRGIFIYRPL